MWKVKLLRWLGWFFAGNVLLFWLMGLRYIAQIVPLPLIQHNLLIESLAWSALLLAYLGQLAFLAGLPLLILAPLAYFFPQRAFIFPLAIFIATLSALLLWADTLIFANFRFHLNGFFFGLFFNRQVEQIFGLSWQEWLAFGLFAFILLIAEITYAFFLWKKVLHQIPIHWGKRSVITLACCLLLSYFMFALGGIYPLLSINKEAYALPLYDNFFSHLLPIKNGFQLVMQNGAGNFSQLDRPNKPLHYPLHPLVCHPLRKPLNLVMIVIDTWRFDMLTPVVTPHLYQFSQHTWCFTHHMSGGNATEPGIFSLFYSLPTSYWTATLQQQRSPVFIDELLKQQYQMGIFASAELVAPAFNRNVFLSIKNLQTITPGTTPFQRDQKITQEFQHFIAQAITHKKPFFSFLFYDAAHSYCEKGNPVRLFQPDIAGCNRLLLTNDTDPTPYRNRYQNALYFVDEQIDQVLTTLKKKNLLNNTVIIITGDHGNEFNDNHLGYWEHASNFTHYQVQTPLIIDWPQQAPHVFQQRTSHYDIVPTLMTQLLGCQNPTNDYSVGTSLFNQQQPRYLIVNSYIDFGIIEPDRITTVFPTGDYRIDAPNGKPLLGAQLHDAIFNQALEDMQKYYKKTN